MNKIIEQYLCPPGNGVFTVSTAADKKASLQQALYQTSNPSEVLAAFSRTLTTIKSIPQDKVAILGICSDTGGGIMRGANWGPLYLREKLYQGRCKERIIDLGDIRIIPHLLHDKYLNTQTIERCRLALYGDNSTLAVSPLSIAEDCLKQLYLTVKPFKCFTIGGDHSVSYPVVKRYLQARKALGKKCGIIHFDAHTDLLHDRLGIDLCFGSWLTHVLPFLESPAHTIQLGIRASGKPKEHWEDTFGIHQYWARDIKLNGINNICQQAIEHLMAEGIKELYISFDIDALDAHIASATGTPEKNGLSLDHALDAIELFSQHFTISGADLVEVAPLVNHGSKDEPGTTLLSAQKVAEALISAMCDE